MAHQYFYNYHQITVPKYDLSRAIIAGEQGYRIFYKSIFNLYYYKQIYNH